MIIVDTEMSEIEKDLSKLSISQTQLFFSLQRKLMPNFAKTILPTTHLILPVDVNIIPFVIYHLDAVLFFDEGSDMLAFYFHHA